MKVIKRDGQSVEFDASKIEKAILKAMQCGKAGSLILNVLMILL